MLGLYIYDDNHEYLFEKLILNLGTLAETKLLTELTSA